MNPERSALDQRGAPDGLSVGNLLSHFYLFYVGMARCSTNRADIQGLGDLPVVGWATSTRCRNLNRTSLANRVR